MAGQLKRVGLQMLELGHAQVRDGDEGRGCFKDSSRAFDLLNRPFHGLHVGIVTVVAYRAQRRRYEF